DYAAVFQFVHDAGGARVAEPETALQQRDARLLLAADDFNALLNQVFVFIARPFFHTVTARGFLQLLMNFHFVTRFALLLDAFDDASDFLISLDLFGPPMFI